MDAESLKGPCDECGSLFFPSATRMSGLCAECAHRLYAYPACVHDITEGRCTRCGWDGSVSAFLAGGAEETP